MGMATHVPKRCRRCTMLVFSGCDGFALSSWSHLHSAKFMLGFILR